MIINQVATPVPSSPVPCLTSPCGPGCGVGGSLPPPRELGTRHPLGYWSVIPGAWLQQGNFNSERPALSEPE